MNATFESAFIATRYLLGRRDTELLDALDAPSADARALVQALSHPERSARARALASALESVVKAHEARRLK